MTDVRPIEGWCYLCNDTHEGEAQAHFADQHPPVYRRPVDEQVPWEDRLDRVVIVLSEIKDEPDHDTRIDRLDVEVIQELYLVRARLAQVKGKPVKTVKEGS